MNEQLVKQYRAQLFTGNGEVIIEGLTSGEVKQRIDNVLDSPSGEVHYEQANPRVILVYDRKGGACGCINEIELPQSMSLKQTTEWRFAAQKAA